MAKRPRRRGGQALERQREHCHGSSGSMQLALRGAAQLSWQGAAGAAAAKAAAAATRLAQQQRVGAGDEGGVEGAGRQHRVALNQRIAQDWPARGGVCAPLRGPLRDLRARKEGEDEAGSDDKRWRQAGEHRNRHPAATPAPRAVSESVSFRSAGGAAPQRVPSSNRQPRDAPPTYTGHATVALAAVVTFWLKLSTMVAAVRGRGGGRVRLALWQGLRDTRAGHSILSPNSKLPSPQWVNALWPSGVHSLGSAAV